MYLKKQKKKHKRHHKHRPSIFDGNTLSIIETEYSYADVNRLNIDRVRTLQKSQT